MSFIRIMKITGIMTTMFLSSCERSAPGTTNIAKWPEHKTGAVSITFDDGTINQFRSALPLLDSLSLKATFFVNTGMIKGSKFPSEFIGRPLPDIVHESAQQPTNRDNLKERASALAFMNFPDAITFHHRAGDLFEDGQIKEAIEVVDEAYLLARTTWQENKNHNTLQDNAISWEEIRFIASNGHEFASHTVSHLRLPILDDVNLRYQLEKSRADLMLHTGPEHTFSLATPFGAHDERTLMYADNLHEVVRNSLRDKNIMEINRWNKFLPTWKAYICERRTAVTKTPMTEMKTWVNNVIENDSRWLVLIFHGVEGIGWEPKSSQEFKAYFSYLKEKESHLWIAPFRDVTKYLRERMNSTVSVQKDDKTITVSLKHTLDSSVYNYPLTLVTFVPSTWREIVVSQGNRKKVITAISTPDGNTVTYQAIPNDGEIVLRSVENLPNQ